MDEDIRERLGQSLMDRQAIDRLSRYVSMVFEEPMNLTGFNRREFWAKGVLDALSLLPWAGEVATAGRCVDVGSGSGLPGMVLAVARPKWQWTLVESRTRRADFLERAAEELGLDNVSVEGRRVEEWLRAVPGVRQGFRLATARAVAPVLAAAELTLPLVAVGGRSLLPVSGHSLAELAGEASFIRKLGGELLLDDGNVAILIKKGLTPLEFPRKGKKMGQV
ncbi:MAG: 16S rRNA (guanine(527)-N(7))-methyltransferase RsmG [Sulfobacillus sp.]